MVDDIELAELLHYLSNHKKLRNALNILNDKGVLLLGRFGGGGLERLYALQEWFRSRGYMAMIFDFERPYDLSLTETVITMAALAKFVVADLSGPSVPSELQAILTQIHKPLLAYGHLYALFPDLEDQTSVITIEDEGPQLLNRLEGTFQNSSSYTRNESCALRAAIPNVNKTGRPKGYARTVRGHRCWASSLAGPEPPCSASRSWKALASGPGRYPFSPHGPEKLGSQST